MKHQSWEKRGKSCSSAINGRIYLPWLLDGYTRQAPYHFNLGYLARAAMIFLLSFTRAARKKTPGGLS